MADPGDLELLWDGRMRAADRRTKVTALAGLAAALVIAAVVITLVGVLDDGPAAPATPGAAAQRWVSAVLQRNRARELGLECAAGSTGRVRLARVGSGVRDVGAAVVQRRGPAAWRVVLELDRGQGRSAVALVLPVVREQGHYLVC